MATTKLYVGNLPEPCDSNALRNEFEQFGGVVEFDIVKNYAFVHYKHPEEAKAAVAALHESTFEGSTLKVEISHSKVRQKPGMGGKNECYRCGREGHWSKDCPKAPPNRRRPMPPPSHHDPYADPYYDPYYRGRYAPPPVDRFGPYPPPYEGEPFMRRRPLPPPPSYYRDRYDPYARPPPDYYYSRRPPMRPSYPSRSYGDEEDSFPSAGYKDYDYSAAHSSSAPLSDYTSDIP